jgi:ABC-2 type transport system permease protein
VYVPILLVFALALLSLVAMSATLAGYRELGVLRRLKTTPAGPVRVLAAQLAVKVTVAVVAVVVIVAVAWLGYGVAAPR